jgi:tetratricopeptide (TPR) repeat protein
MSPFSRALVTNAPYSVLVILLVVVTASAQTNPAQSGSMTAIIGVNVIPMDEDRVLKDQTVIIADGRITEIGNTGEVTVPDAAKRIDGNNRYLMPGLADLHTHLRGADEYVSYLAFGVTTVMHLGGSESRGRELLEHRRQISAGSIIGPNIYTTERTFDGDPPASGGAYRFSSPDAARKKVAELKDAGFDFIKIYNNVSYPVFQAIVDEAQQQDMPVFGHVPRNFDPLTAMREGQNAVVHTEEFFFTYFKGPRSTVDMDRGYRADLSAIPALVDTLVENNVAVMPDLAFTFTDLLMWDSLENIWTDAEMRYVHPDTVSDWQVSNINRRDEIENFVIREQWKYELMQELTRQFQQAGILQVIGTDASLPGLFPGKAAHRELTELVKTGLSNFDALSIGTRNAGEFVRRYIDEDARFGQIEIGYRADLLLLAENPLDDVRNASRVEAVAVNGRWFENTELDHQREILTTRFQALNDVNEQVDAALEGDQAGFAIHDILTVHSDDTETVAAIERRINSAGYAAAFAEQFDRARTILEIGTQLFPDSANSWDSLAEITLNSGDREKAIEYYKQALEVDPEFSNAAAQLNKQAQSESE